MYRSVGRCAYFISWSCSSSFSSRAGGWRAGVLVAGVLACSRAGGWRADLLMHLELLPQAHGFVPKLIDCGFAHLLTEEQAAEQAKGDKSMFTMGSTSRGVIGTQVLCTMVVLHV